VLPSGGLRGAWVGHGPPDFWLAPCQFCAEFHVQVRLIDIYSK